MRWAGWKRLSGGIWRGKGEMLRLVIIVLGIAILGLVGSILLSRKNERYKNLRMFFLRMIVVVMGVSWLWFFFTRAGFVWKSIGTPINFLLCISVYIIASRMFSTGTYIKRLARVVTLNFLFAVVLVGLRFRFVAIEDKGPDIEYPLLAYSLIVPSLAVTSLFVWAPIAAVVLAISSSRTRETI